MEFDLKTHWLSVLLVATAILAVTLGYFITQTSSGEEITMAAFGLLAAFALLKTHKTSWLVAIISLIIAAGAELSHLIEIEDTQSPAAIAIDLAALAVLVFALVHVFRRSKYPHLDRRQGWFKAPAHRFDVHLPVILKTEQEVTGITESLSLSGCRIKIGGVLPSSFNRRFVEIQFKDLPQVTIRAQNVGMESSVLRLKFKDFVHGDHKTYADWLTQLSGNKSARLKS